MGKRINLATLSSLIALLLLMGCQFIGSKDGSSVKDATQKQDLALIRTGVSPELHEQAVKEGEKAKEELQQLKQDQSLSATAKRILAEAEEAEEQGDQSLYLAKIQEYRRILNDEPLKRAAESWELEGRVLFSQLRLKEAQKAIAEAVKLDDRNPEYLLTLVEYLLWNGDYQQMEEVSLQDVSVIESAEPINEKLLSRAHSFLGLAYLYGGKYNLAQDFLQQSLEMRKKLLGEEHPNTPTINSNLLGLRKKLDQQ
ncbi:MAG: tetratricopeptide repeat protein [Cyanobacteria bacterium P01_G01_bin.67]